MTLPGPLLFAALLAPSQAAAAPAPPALPAHLTRVEDSDGSAAGGGTSPMRSPAVLKAAVDRSQTTGRAGIITTYSGLGASVLGLGLITRGVIQATEDEDLSSGVGNAVGGYLLTVLGGLAFTAGTVTLSTSSLSGALHLRKLSPTHSAVAGWTSVGGVAALAGGMVASMANPDSRSQVPGTVAGIGLLTALVSGHVQHAQNRRSRESLAALHPRTPGPLAPTLADY